MLMRIFHAPIRYRLPAIIASSLITVLLASSFFFFGEFKLAAQSAAKTSSETMSRVAKGNLNDWMANFTRQMDGLAVDPYVLEALARLDRLERNPNSPSFDEVRKTYIDDNPNPLESRNLLDRGPDNNPYDTIHANFHAHFRGILQRSGYYDLFLILQDGTIAYSVQKEDDFGTSMVSGPYSNSGLGELFRRTMASDPGDVIFEDFKPYAPSADQPASFLAKKVIGVTGDELGVIAIQLPISSLNTALIQDLTLAPTDEVYIIGEDGLSRSASLEPGIMGILEPVSDLPHIKHEITGDYYYADNTTGTNGHKALALVTPIAMKGANWRMVVERDHSVAFASLTTFITYASIFVGVAAALSLLVGYLTARSIARPLAEVEYAMEELAHENYQLDIPGKERSDEIGNIANVLEGFRQKLIRSQEADRVLEQGRAEQAHVVSSLAKGLDALADGDLTVNLDKPFSQDYESLRKNFNRTVQTIADLIRGIVNNAEEILSRAEEISASSDDLSARTESQAATLEETAAALDELTASVKESANGASEVERVVTNARGEAEDSGRVVAEAVEAMSMIRKSSTEISQIIGVIDDIAFQTNLLSLNAGVEAARAGEAGRGFAVVASEVRALAQRSSDAAKQIKELINSSSQQVDTGVGLVARTGDALNSIIERVGNIDTLMNNIATGAREQSVGLGEINIGMSQLDQVTQQNAAMVSEATSTASTLKSEALSLSHVVSRFKLSQGNQASGSEMLPMPTFRSVNIENIKGPETANTMNFKPMKTPEPIAQDNYESAAKVANAADWKDF